MERTLDVTLKLLNDEDFMITIRDNESGLSKTFTQDTPDILVEIGAEIMGWVDIMDYEEE